MSMEIINHQVSKEKRFHHQIEPINNKNRVGCGIMAFKAELLTIASGISHLTLFIRVGEMNVLAGCRRNQVHINNIADRSERFHHQAKPHTNKRTLGGGGIGQGIINNSTPNTVTTNQTKPINNKHTLGGGGNEAHINNSTPLDSAAVDELAPNNKQGGKGYAAVDEHRADNNNTPQGVGEIVNAR